MQEKKIALLIDAENVTSAYRHTIFNELTKYGTTTIRRIYGDFVDSPNINWKRETLLKHSLTPVQQFSYSVGKNSSDMTMVIDAMDILYSDNVDGFCIVSSDSDFTKLASRLREAGKLVIGMGEKKTPMSLRTACEKFILLDVIFKDAKIKTEETKSESKDAKESKPKRNAKTPSKASPVPKPQSEKTPAAKPAPAVEPVAAEATDDNKEALASLDKIVAIIRDVILPDSGDDEGWASLADVGNRLSKLFPEFDSRNYKFQKLSQLMKSLTNDFEIKAQKGEGNTKIYLMRSRTQQ